MNRGKRKKPDPFQKEMERIDRQAEEAENWEGRAEVKELVDRHLSRAFAADPPTGVYPEDAEEFADQLAALNLDDHVEELAFGQFRLRIEKRFDELKARLGRIHPSTQDRASEEERDRLQRYYGWRRLHSVDSLHQAAAIYFYKKVRTEWAEKPLDEALSHVNSRIDQLENLVDPWFWDDPTEYVLSAFKAFQTELRKEVTRRKEAFDARLVSGQGTQESDENEKVSPERRKDRSTLILSYLFEYAEVKKMSQTAKSVAISKVSGFSADKIEQSFSRFNNMNKEYQKHLNKGQGYCSKCEPFVKDICSVKKYFNDLGLEDIVEMVERDYSP